MSSCQNQRAVWLAADQDLGVAIDNRNAAAEATVAAKDALVSAEAAEAQAEVAAVDAANAADESYSAYIACVKGDPVIQPIRR